MGSGAADSEARPSVLPQVPVTLSNGSACGQTSLTSNGTLLANESWRECVECGVARTQFDMSGFMSLVHCVDKNERTSTEKETSTS